MTTDYDHFDAPPPDDPPEFHPGIATPNDYVLKLANAIDRLASVLDRVEARTTPTGGAQPPGPPPGAAGPPVASGGNETQIKRGKAIFAKCKNQNPPADIKAIGEHVTGRSLHWNSQEWAEADQVQVLDAMKSWGWT